MTAIRRTCRGPKRGRGGESRRSSLSAGPASAGPRFVAYRWSVAVAVTRLRQDKGGPDHPGAWTEGRPSIAATVHALFIRLKMLADGRPATRPGTRGVTPQPAVLDLATVEFEAWPRAIPAWSAPGLSAADDGPEHGDHRTTCLAVTPRA